MHRICNPEVASSRLVCGFVRRYGVAGNTGKGNTPYYQLVNGLLRNRTIPSEKTQGVVPVGRNACNAVAKAICTFIIVTLRPKRSRYRHRGQSPGLRLRLNWLSVRFYALRVIGHITLLLTESVVCTIMDVVATYAARSIVHTCDSTNVPSGRSSMVERLASTQDMRVRFPLSASIVGSSPTTCSDAASLWVASSFIRKREGGFDSPCCDTNSGRDFLPSADHRCNW